MEQPDQSKKFMQTGFGVLALVLAGIVILPLLCCGGLFFLGVIGSAASGVNP